MYGGELNQVWSNLLENALDSVGEHGQVAVADEHVNLGPYAEAHLAVMARLHRENRYDRLTDTVEKITGRPAESVEEFVARRKNSFGE
jgi:signal transduction histidine kinase